jgi:hypothetical protein
MGGNSSSSSVARTASKLPIGPKMIMRGQEGGFSQALAGNFPGYEHGNHRLTSISRPTHQAPQIRWLARGSRLYRQLCVRPGRPSQPAIQAASQDSPHNLPPASSARCFALKRIPSAG